MTTLVTGGTGLIGASVARLLITEYDQKVVVFDRNPPAPNGVLSDLGDRLVPFIGNVTDLSQILHVVQDNDVDYIVHTGAIVSAAANLHPIEALETNVIGTANVLEAARLFKLKRVISTSSSSVFGAPEDIVTPRREEDIVLPATGIYPLSKITGEHLVHTYRKLYGVDAAAVRPRAVYGPGSARFLPRSVPTVKLIEAAAKGEDIIKPSGADTVFDVTYVKDQALGIVRALLHEGELAHHVYNLSYGRNISLGDLAEVIRQAVPEIKVELGPGLWEGILERGEQRDLTYRGSQRPPLDVSRAREDFGYEPAWPIERAVPDFIRWLRDSTYGEF